MATTTSVFIGDTITLGAEFTNKVGTLIDADGSAVTFTCYENENLNVLSTATATRSSTGVYYYDWLVPAGDGLIYVLEMKGLFSTKPQLKRVRVRTRFRP